MTKKISIVKKIQSIKFAILPLLVLLLFSLFALFYKRHDFDSKIQKLHDYNLVISNELERVREIEKRLFISNLELTTNILPHILLNTNPLQNQTTQSFKNLETPHEEIFLNCDFRILNNAFGHLTIALDGRIPVRVGTLFRGEEVLSIDYESFSTATKTYYYGRISEHENP